MYTGSTYTAELVIRVNFVSQIGFHLLLTDNDNIKPDCVALKALCHDISADCY